MTFEEWWGKHGWVPISSTEAAKELAQQAWDAATDNTWDRAQEGYNGAI